MTFSLLSLSYQTWFIFHQKAQHFIKWNVFTVIMNKEQLYRNCKCVLSLRSNVTYHCISTQFHFHFIFIINKRHVLLWKVDVKLKITIWKSTHTNKIKSCSSLPRLCKICATTLRNKERERELQWVLHNIVLSGEYCTSPFIIYDNEFIYY